MNDTRRALGRGLGALIPTGADEEGRPVDVFFGARVTDRVSSQPGAVSAATTTANGDASSGQSGGAGHDAAFATAGGPQSPAQPAPGTLRPVPGLTFAELPLDAIEPNPRQPRTAFDEDQLGELATSIQQIGILQPVVVRPVEAPPDPLTGHSHGRFELVVGERRWRAARLAGLSHVPAIVKATHDDDLLRDALLENLHRSQLNPLEEAAAYRQLLDDFGCTQDELASRIGRSRPQVSNTLRLLRLPALVQRRVAAGVLSAGHARALLGLTDAAAMERLAQRIVAEGLSVRSVEEIVAVGLAPPPSSARRTTPGGPRDPQLEDVAARMSDALDTNVRVSLGQRKGRLVIEFASVQDLHRIVARMGVDDVER